MTHRTRTTAALAAAVVALAACGPADDAPDTNASQGAQTAVAAGTLVSSRATAPPGATARVDGETTPPPERSAPESARPRAASEPAPGERGPDSAATAPRRVAVAGIDLTGIGYDVGDPAAPVVLVNFSDFGCPYCGSFARETYPALERAYVRTGKVFLKYVPFVMGMFPNGAQAARAAECAAEEGKFWPMHARLYAAQAVWKRSRSPHQQVFQGEAKALGLDPARFNACYVEQRTDARTAAATDRAERLGIRATPSFFVNGQLIEGALPLPQFRQALDAALREAR